MISLNKVMLIGHLGNNPELKYTPYGSAVANFRMAVNHRYTDFSGIKHDKTEWFNISLWGNNAEIANRYLIKGRKVFVEGRLKSNEFIGNDGMQRKYYEIVANNFRFMDNKPNI